MYNTLQIAIDMFGLQDDTPRSRYKVLCPFHADHHPSMYLYHDGRYRCYACGERGSDAISLLQAMYDIDAFAAMDMLYPYYGSGKTGILDHQPDRVYNDTRFHTNMKLAKDVWNDVYQPGMKKNWRKFDHPAKHYLLSRGYLPETMEKFHIVVWDALHSYPIMFPLAFNDDVYGFMLRTINGNSTPKYLTMEGMKKMDHVYGTARQNKPLLVAEGLLDIYMAYQYGFQDVATVLGSETSTQQAEEIAALQPSYIISAFDGDCAGFVAHQRFCFMMSLYDIPIHRLPMSKKDIGLMGRQEFQDTVEKITWYF